MIGNPYKTKPSRNTRRVLEMIEKGFWFDPTAKSILVPGMKGVIYTPTDEEYSHIILPDHSSNPYPRFYYKADFDFAEGKDGDNILVQRFAVLHQVVRMVIGFKRATRLNQDTMDLSLSNMFLASIGDNRRYCSVHKHNTDGALRQQPFEVDKLPTNRSLLCFGKNNPLR